MQKGLFVKIVTVFLLLPFILLGLFLTASAQAVCPEGDVPRGLTENEYIAILSACEKEADIDAQKARIENQKGVTYKSEIVSLNAKIKQDDIAIKVRGLTIDGLTYDIVVKNKNISKLSTKEDNQRDSLAQLLRKTNEIDSYSLAEVALSDKPLSEFFGDLDAFQYVEDAISNSLVEIGATKKTNEEQKIILEDKKTKEADLKYKQELGKKRTEANEAEKQRLLRVTKGNEAVYQKDLKEKQKKASQIRAALFKLRDTDGIPFEKALEYATLASKGTNVRPALILAILTQESNLGKNIGSCLLSSVETGDGVGKNSGTFFERVMYSATDTKRPSDTVPFVNITSRLGFDWKITPVSCPPAAKYVSNRGFGGAMGPSQFIPSTWELFKAKIGAIVGVSANDANPWNPEHAIIGTALLLKERGANNGGYTAERNAACRYYSGRKCDNQKPYNTFYGNQVLKLAEGIQVNIDFLKGS